MRSILGMIQNIDTRKSATAKFPRKKFVTVRNRLNRIKLMMTSRLPKSYQNLFNIFI